MFRHQRGNQAPATAPARGALPADYLYRLPPALPYATELALRRPLRASAPLPPRERRYGRRARGAAARTLTDGAAGALWVLLDTATTLDARRRQAVLLALS